MTPYSDSELTHTSSPGQSTLSTTLLGLPLAVFSTAAMAIEQAPPALPAGPGIGQTVFALVFIIGVLLGLAWILKRLGLSKFGGQSGFLKVISVANLGTREKIALVEVGETWLVVGMTPSSINTLHSMPKGSIDIPGGVDTAQAFAKLLEKVKRPQVS